MSTFHLHNTLSGQKEAFVPIDENHVRIYACGPTVYNYAHIGNARMAVVFDLLSTVLKALYPKVTYASNITDVDDKIIERARETGENIQAITRKYTEIYNNDMGSLGVALPDIQPRATEHIQDMIDLIQSLIDADHAYANEGHVLFSVESFPKYGTLSRRSRDEQIAGARVEVAPYKKDPADFVLWKPSNGDEPGWDSPWGFGRPGWHIECSAMSERHLGLPFDIHGGGADLKFPHHENEIAQSCCAHGHENNVEGFSKYWMHNGFVTVSGEKMSKSIGNIRLVHDLLDHYPGEVLRLTLLSAHYRQPLDFTETALDQSRAILDKLYNWLHNAADVEADTENTSIPEDFMTALCDDLNTPKALAVLQSLDKADMDKAQIKACLLKAGQMLGILNEAPASWLGYGSDDMSDEDSANIDDLLAQREQARADKNFARADEIRDELTALGITIEDTPEGPKWRRAS